LPPLGLVIQGTFVLKVRFHGTVFTIMLAIIHCSTEDQIVVDSAPANSSGHASLRSENPEKSEREKRLQERKRWARKVVTVVKASRQDADVSRRQLADWVGMTPSQIANMEHGRREIRVVDLIMIAQAIRVDPETLFRRILRW
jgi:ribosome-binding protein aMBF1 (putative translation factor)